VPCSLWRQGVSGGAKHVVAATVQLAAGEIRYVKHMGFGAYSLPQVTSEQGRVAIVASRRAAEIR